MVHSCSPASQNPSSGRAGNARALCRYSQGGPQGGDFGLRGGRPNEHNECFFSPPQAGQALQSAPPGVSIESHNARPVTILECKTRIPPRGYAGRQRHQEQGCGSGTKNTGAAAVRVRTLAQRTPAGGQHRGGSTQHPEYSLFPLSNTLISNLLPLKDAPSTLFDLFIIIATFAITEFRLFTRSASRAPHSRCNLRHRFAFCASF